ncbi:MAG: hypothetical protein L0G99_15650 [Propionibacteriales bacterium]|nr:hypothetical protein [Propionibacteriales bacterium]
MMTTTITRHTTTETLLEHATDRTDWVDAAPFRAHLLLLLDVSGLSLPQLAGHLGMPLAMCQNLLVGRPGRPPMRRISTRVAAGLIRHTPASVTESAQRQVSAYDARRLVRSLLASGWTLELLSEAGGIGRTTLARLTDGELTRCTNRLELAVRALHTWAEARTAPATLRPSAGHASRAAAGRSTTLRAA